MITTLLLDAGGTIFIKKSDGMGIVNPAIIYLNNNIPSSIHVVILSDTDAFDISKLLQQTFPDLHYDNIYTKMMYPWIDKTKPETYKKVCGLIGKDPTECILIDNEVVFKDAAAAVGIKTYNIDQQSIEEFLNNLK